MHSTQHCPFQNHLLASWPVSEFKWLEANLELVYLSLGQVLYESGHTLDSAYFPTTAIVSMRYMLENGVSAGIAIVGNEGILGISLIIGGDTTLSQAVVQSAGWCYRLRARHIKKEFQRGGTVMVVLLRYIRALIIQMTLTTVCYRHHCIEQQLCRWLLLSLDRLASNSLTITQVLIADTLGVRRESVSEAAGKLQRAGYIRYVRGQITVIDRPGIEKRVCECYAVIKRESERLLSIIPVNDPEQVLGQSSVDLTVDGFCPISLKQRGTE